MPRRADSSSTAPTRRAAVAGLVAPALAAIAVALVITFTAGIPNGGDVVHDDGTPNAWVLVFGTIGLVLYILAAVSLSAAVITLGRRMRRR